MFGWLRPKTPTKGPTPEGLYGQLPRGARWVGGPDPAGDPAKFVPESDAYVFDIAEWRWEQHLWITARTRSTGSQAGFGLVLELSDGTSTDAVELWTQGPRNRPMLKERQEWVIPRGHPTRQLALISHGEPTTQVLRKLEQCFGQQPLTHPALPDKTAMMGEMVLLRGIVLPDEGRFTARTKIALPERGSWPYCEFFLNVNSVRKQIWLSEKSSEYRVPILTRISHFG